MGKYRVLLLDDDGTLLDYDKAERNALRETLLLYGFGFSEKALRQYRQINGELWKKIERGETTLPTLQVTRFARLFEYMRVKCDTDEFNSLYLKQLGQNAPLIDNADYVCKELSRRASLCIIANGIASASRIKISRSGLMPYMSGIFISEEIGFAKPHRYFFDAVFPSLGDVPKNKILIVGDSLSADIAGGHTVGVDTCWYNPKGDSNKGALRPTYEISSLEELLKIVG